MFYSLIAIAALFVNAQPSEANFWDRIFRFPNGAGSYTHEIYVPEKLQERPGLVVALHGCIQSARQLADGTRLNEAADDKGFIVLYPEQSYQNNPLRCWNWFRAENQQSKPEGDTAFILDLIEKTIQERNIDRNRVYLVGFSAGGAMATNLMGCHPNVFKGAVVHSGLEFQAANTEAGAHAVMRSGPDQDLDESAAEALRCMGRVNQPLPMIFVHGASDTTVNPVNFTRSNTQFEKINQKIAQRLGGRGVVTTKQSVVKGERYNADLVETFIDRVPMQRAYLVQRMGHAWSGGSSSVPYMEPAGIPVTQILSDYFFPSSR